MIVSIMNPTELLPNTNPLFIAKVNKKGQITIRSDVRENQGIVECDKVAVYVMKKVVK
jgi:bifunctional DNA-binding transcriptional regulator/antitoxin component of YhaV-PrlF toxin-antitoxin module